MSGGEVRSREPAASIDAAIRNAFASPLSLHCRKQHGQVTPGRMELVFLEGAAVSGSHRLGRRGRRLPRRGLSGRRIRRDPRHRAIATAVEKRGCEASSLPRVVEVIHRDHLIEHPDGPARPPASLTCLPIVLPASGIQARQTKARLRAILARGKRAEEGVWFIRGSEQNRDGAGCRDGTAGWFSC